LLLVTSFMKVFFIFFTNCIKRGVLIDEILKEFLVRMVGAKRLTNLIEDLKIYCDNH
jgi:hypothetical protein